MQACLYDDVEQWLHQLLEDGRITENSVHKFKTMQEQVSTQSHSRLWQPTADKYSKLLIITGTRNVVVFNNNKNYICAFLQINLMKPILARDRAGSNSFPAVIFKSLTG